MKWDTNLATPSKNTGAIEFVKSKQSDAVIFIQANLHVTKSRSDSDKVVNNTAINGLNAELAKLADGKSKFYLMPIFCSMIKQADYLPTNRRTAHIFMLNITVSGANGS